VEYLFPGDFENTFVEDVDSVDDDARWVDDDGDVGVVVVPHWAQRMRWNSQSKATIPSHPSAHSSHSLTSISLPALVD